MADADWKKRVGFTINYSSSGEDDDLSVEYRVKNPSPETVLLLEIDNDLRRRSDELASKFEEYGSTPPRTRIKMKHRDWDRKHKNSDTTSAKSAKGQCRLQRSRTNRRNTVDCAILNEMFIEDGSKKPTDKRAQNLLRESERDQKVAMAPIFTPSSTVEFNKKIAFEDRADSLPTSRCARLTTTSKLIESSNRYMSVASRPVGCRTSAPPLAFDNQIYKYDRSKLKTRREFHETFANLIKLGSSSDRQENKLSHEDYTWQTELKDMIWLELQAWHADRSLDQQDKYLYTARQGVPDLLDKILNYRFNPTYARELSTTSIDSGNVSDSTFENGTDLRYHKDCLSLYCQPCQQQQTIALREVEELLTRLDAVEALYPSSQVMGSCHPVYKCSLFVGRVKAMCLWYNISKHQRLKLTLVGRLFKKLNGKDFQWPMPPTDDDPISPTPGTNDSGLDSVDSQSPIVIHNKTIPKVKFDIDDSTTSVSSTSTETASSNESTREELHSDEQNEKVTFSEFVHDKQNVKKPYRKYIEHALKMRGLSSSLLFLHRLYNVVLRKTQMTLEKPGSEDFESEIDLFNESGILNQQILTPIGKEQEEELRRYGSWSPEAQSLNLPSYAPTFVFLSIIPLEILQEYLKMKLEARPVTPNPLSLEQLIKELREGLILAMTHRERCNKHIHTALLDKESKLEKYITILDEFDNTVKDVLGLYLDYVEQYILDAAPHDQRKSALHKEWMFSKLISPMIQGYHQIAAKKFCSIVSILLQRIGNRLVSRATDLKGKIEKTPIDQGDEDKRWQILTICREIQTLFTVERENSLKVLNFAKGLCRDLETSDFHRDHETDGKTLVCENVKKSVMALQVEVLSVRHKLTKIVGHVQHKVDVQNLGDIDEIDRIAIITRTREILHQGFKYGFDYHKEILRLFDNNIITCKDRVCEFNLSLGIINFAKMWMLFVTEKCERGRGVRPRWAAQGLEFLIAACDPVNTKHLTEEEFDDLKSKMDACISHVVGIVSEPERTRKRSSPRSRKISPAPNRALTPTRSSMSPRLAVDEQRLFVHQLSMKEESVSAPNTPQLVRKQSSYETDSSDVSLKVPKFPNAYGVVLRQIRIRDAVNQLDLDLDKKMKNRNLIGQVKSLHSSNKVHLGAKTVNFRWHRGIKIGQGRFGKVYTAVNNSTGELMAMKEIPVQPNETRAIKKVAEELKIFEGIHHKYLVKYYGVEVHREELLIFMELCAEGTLESLVELSGGLYEALNRRYTTQLASAVAELHRHGVVHRDIKTANIFLTNGGNCLKLGDFGSAVKIQAHTTMPGELQGYVGTQAYMAPEVFTKTNTDGHGRAADIWSVGCVVIEMASGKRPWSQFDSNFQIMFKVGMGETPEAPDSLSEEGHDFLKHCLEHDPKVRWTALELLQHNFCKVNLDNDCNCNNVTHTNKVGRNQKNVQKNKNGL